MHYRASFLPLAVVAALVLASCGDKPPANDPAVAAAILSQAAMSGKQSSGARALDARAISFNGSASIAASAYASDFSGLTTTTFSLTFTNQEVSYEGNTYLLNGTLAYALKTEVLSLPSLAFKALVYAKGFSISGADYEGSFDADFEEDLAIASDTMTCKVKGSVAGASVDTTVVVGYSTTR